MGCCDTEGRRGGVCFVRQSESCKYYSNIDPDQIHHWEECRGLGCVIVSSDPVIICS